MFTYLTLLAQTNIDLTPRGGASATDAGFTGLKSITIGNLIGGLITLALIVAAVVFFFMLVIGGVRWIISGGDKAQTEAARSQITAALIGLVIVFAAWAISQIIGTFFGITLFGPEGTITLPSVVP